MQFWDQICPVLNFTPGCAISNTIFMINELDLLCVLNFIELGIYFIFGTKFSWNEGIDTYFNVECVLLRSNWDFLSGYLVVTALCLVVTAGYCLLLDGYWWLLLVTACYCLFPILVWTQNHLRSALCNKI